MGVAGQGGTWEGYLAGVGGLGWVNPQEDTW